MEHIVAFFNEYEDDNSSLGFLKECFENEILSPIKSGFKWLLLLNFVSKYYETDAEFRRIKLCICSCLVESDDLKSSLEH